MYVWVVTKSFLEPHSIAINKNPSVCPGRHASRMQLFGKSNTQPEVELRHKSSECTAATPFNVHHDSIEIDLQEMDHDHLNEEHKRYSMTSDSGEESSDIEVDDGTDDKNSPLPDADSELSEEVLECDVDQGITCINTDEGKADSPCQPGIIRALSYFLFFFQLKFRVPDCAIGFLLAFIKGFLPSIIALVPSNKSVSKLYNTLPLSVPALRKLKTSMEQTLTKYVTCPVFNIK